ncbi:GntR family transcriptional regulator [Streptomyces corynorhini]|uniref:GntR family transcriptional regulator n=1 Tax=Streptomyces corynorhini TaxID=2282652 RepID=A0A370B296_9ACTN|nr:GntR family transcriptional regulator [Streptomyces corynorhini]RDG35997.1 GntR family transcriptional regulator [Streptomyces corynorhini]
MGEPRYAAIANDLTAKLATGRWAVGALLPTEPELAASYKVSRETLRRALQRLEASGLISRHPGTGTRVERAQPAPAFTTRLGSLQELTQYARSAVRSVLSVEPLVVDRELAESTGLARGSRTVCVTSVRQDHEHADQVVSWARVYLDPADADAIGDDLRGSPRLISDLVETHAHRTVDRVVQRVRAVGVPPEAAARLGVAPGSPGLEFVRRYYDADGQLFEVSVSTHAQGTFVYETTLQRG